MKTMTLHWTFEKHPGIRTTLGLLGLLFLLLFGIIFQLHQSRQNSYLPYDAQEGEAK